MLGGVCFILIRVYAVVKGKGSENDLQKVEKASLLITPCCVIALCYSTTTYCINCSVFIHEWLSYEKRNCRLTKGMAWLIKV